MQFETWRNLWALKMKCHVYLGLCGFFLKSRLPYRLEIWRTSTWCKLVILVLLLYFSDSFQSSLQTWKKATLIRTFAKLRCERSNITSKYYIHFEVYVYTRFLFGIYQVPWYVLREIPGVTQVKGHADITAVATAYLCWVKHGHRSSRTGVPADYYYLYLLWTFVI